MRVYQAAAPRAAEGMRLERYVTLALPLLPGHVVREAFQARDVKINGKRAGRDEAVREGDRVMLYTAFDVSLPIVYEDDNLIIIKD